MDKPFEMVAPLAVVAQVRLWQIITLFRRHLVGNLSASEALNEALSRALEPPVIHYPPK
jgi:hypothetical protein